MLTEKERRAGVCIQRKARRRVGKVLTWQTHGRRNRRHTPLQANRRNGKHAAKLGNSVKVSSPELSQETQRPEKIGNAEIRARGTPTGTVQWEQLHVKGSSQATSRQLAQSQRIHAAHGLLRTFMRKTSLLPEPVPANTY